MKEYPGPDGKRRLWCEPFEIEEIIEDELNKGGLFPSLPNPVVNVEAFLEQYLGVKLDQYAILESEVLGVTQFIQGATPRVLINRDLTGAALDQEYGPPGLLGRWRATLAHEAAHVILHRFLFELPLAQGSLFCDDETIEQELRPNLVCMKRDLSFTNTPSDWREVQANMGMAALLMPRKTFCQIVADILDCGQPKTRILQLPAQGSLEVSVLAATLAENLEVSRQAATIRLKTLGFIGQSNQGQLEVSR